MTLPSPNAIDFAIARPVVEQAALSGSFDPLSLVSGLDEDGQLTALNALAEDCTVNEVSGSLTWTITPDARRRVLSELASSGKLVEVASTAGSNGDDVFGAFLRKALTGASIPAADLDPRSLDELHTALQFARPFTDGAMESEVNKVLGRRDAEETVSYVRPKRMFGRDRELDEIIRFASFSGPSEESTLLVNGIGGAGKSALLSEAVARIRGTDWSGPAVVWFDFDRALFGSLDTMTMLLEFTRQLSLHLPDLARKLSEFRKVGRERWQGLMGRHRSYQQRAGYDSELWSLWNEILAGSLPLHKPVVLILDTFEEILLRESYELRILNRWVETLRTEGGIRGLRTIISGRIGSEAPVLELQRARRLDLDDLNTYDAVALLSHFIDAEGSNPLDFPTQELAEALGGHPLMLKLAGRYCASIGPEATEDLLGQQEGDLRKELSYGFLYSRILSRIRSKDAAIAKLAHPGLALRRVTPEIIQEVLAEPCDLGEIDAQRARDIFGELVRQVWLVERVGHHQAVHRAELRRHMLPLIANQAPEAFKRVHESAARYYSALSDPYLSPSLQNIERRYHELFLARADELDSDLSALLDIVGQDVEALDPSIRALLKGSGGHALSALESGTLGTEASSRLVSSRAKTALDRGVDLFGGDEPGRSSFSVDDGDAELQFQARFETGDLSAALDIFLMNSYELTSQYFDVPSPRFFPEPFHQSTLWKAAIIGLLHPNRGPEVLEAINRSIPRLDDDSRSLTSDLVVYAIRCLFGGPAPHNWRSPDRDGLEELRLIQLGISPLEALYLEVGLISYLAPPLVQELAKMDRNLLPFARPSANYQRPTLAMVRKPLSAKTTFDVTKLSAGQNVALRGLTPELYGPLRTLLLNCGDEQIQSFAGQLGDSLDWWPEELTPSKLAVALPVDRGRWSATIIETADLAGELNSLVEFCRRSTRLPSDEIGLMYEKYDARLRLYL